MLDLGEAEALEVEVVVQPRGRILLPFLLAMLLFKAHRLCARHAQGQAFSSKQDPREVSLP